MPRPKAKQPKKCPITLQQRLKRWIGKPVAITANDLSLEPGQLTDVLKNGFIIVQNEKFVPLSANYLTVFDVPKAGSFRRAGIRTTFDSEGMFDDIQMIKAGKDFIELQSDDPQQQQQRILMPLNKVVGIFSI